MSTSQHPIAYRLEQQVGDAMKLLATVMALPLVDGIFPALVLAGALDSAVGVFQVGLLVFGGSATVAVILAELDGHPHEYISSILTLGVILVAIAALEAALAPTISSVLNLVVFERFAALVILAVAAKTASATIGEYLPRPAVIIGLGMIASFDPAGAEFVTMLDLGLIVKAAASAAVGTGFALAVAVFGTQLREVLDVDRFRFGSATALGVLPLSVLGFAPDTAPLLVLAVASVLAFDPSNAPAADDSGSGQATASTPAAAGGATATDGGQSSNDSEDPDTASYGYPDESNGDERKPWL